MQPHISDVTDNSPPRIGSTAKFRGLFLTGFQFFTSFVCIVISGTICWLTMCRVP
jgi:hypothetical protein